QVAPKAEVAAAGSGSARFDGNYQGRFCNYNESKGGTTRCWTALLTAQDGKLSSTWPSRSSTDLVRAKGTVAQDGSASLTIDGFLPDGRPLRGTLSGNLA